jgi:hypothetical protein
MAALASLEQTPDFRPYRRSITESGSNPAVRSRISVTPNIV